ncbi:hypothetical protein P3L10_003845 [Capsicum annuum]
MFLSFAAAGCSFSLHSCLLLALFMEIFFKKVNYSQSSSSNPIGRKMTYF